ncbi:TPA: DUF3638 domain-containing protein [Legionella pneumophila]|nr:DUF3638 domain-containing protein [Legionella pneumophila]
MPKYTQEMANLFANLEPHQVELFVGMLSVDAIKIIRTEVLPQIKDTERRIFLKQTLAESEGHLKQSSKKSQASQQLENISDQLKNLYDNLTTVVLWKIADDDAQKRFIAEANDEQLLILKRKTSPYKDEHSKTFNLAIENEIERRKQENLGHSSISKKENLQWEANVWLSIIDKIKKVNSDLEIERREQAEKQVKPVQPQGPTVVEKSWWSNFKESVSNLFSSSKPVPTPYKLEISEKEKSEIDELRREGAQRIANNTGVVKVGEAEELSAEGKKKAMMSRFGMVMASQMVAGTKSDNHRILYNVLESLAQPEDDDDALEKIQNAIKPVIPDTPEQPNPLKGKHACATGGNPEFVTAFESEVVQKLLSSPEHFEQYGVRLSEKEKEKVLHYHENMERSRDINNVITSICYSWGGYEKDTVQKGYKKSENFETKQARYEERLGLASKGLQEACAKLQDGQSLYLETGVENHAMQLVIKKVGNEFKLSTYDSSGALENTSLSQSLFGLFKLSRLRSTGAMRRNAYSFTVPQEKLISEQGLNYLSGLIRSNSMAGWAQTHINQNLQTATREEMSHMNWFQRLYALREARAKYKVYMDHFASLASPDSPPKFDDLLQHPQNTSNCFAKKAQSCELYELGKPVYKKFRLAMLLEQKDKLLSDIEGQDQFVSMEYRTMLKNIEPEYLSPTELHEISMRLCEVKEPPTKGYYEKFFQTLLDAREKLVEANNDDNKLAIQRIDEKIASHAQSYYNYLSKGNRQSEIQQIFSSEVCSQGNSYNWKTGAMPFKTGLDGKIDPTALGKISEYASAQAWKASMQMLNHQIKKLSVNERYISSSKERLSHASTREASGKVTLKDLENANIVNFTTGFTRQEETKIEINVGGKRREIDKATFFELIVKNKESLTNPKVISLLDSLRNTSPAIEKRYMKEVYPTQRKAFESKVEQNSSKSGKLLEETISSLKKHQMQIEPMIQRSDENIRLITDEIDKEKLNSNGKRSIKLDNLELRLALLKIENQELKDLKASVSTKIESLELEHGSIKGKIAKAEEILKLLQTPGALKSINEINHAFLDARAELESVERELNSTKKEFEVNDIENHINDRMVQINHYRQKIVGRHLQANAEYRILDELSAGRMGTEKDRNRNMYRQTESERSAFNKQGKNTFLPGSVFQEIQSLNQKLKTKVNEIAERQIILGTNISDTVSLASLESANDKYMQMDRQAQELSKKSIPQEIKEEWVREMFNIWLSHESKDRLYHLQKKYGDDPSVGINQAFHHFIEQKANIKYAALKEAGYEIDLDKSKIVQMGWKPISEQELGEYHEKRKQAASKLMELFKFKRVLEKLEEGIQSKEKTVTPEPVTLTSEDLSAQHEVSLVTKGFVPPEVTFLSQSQREALDGSTLKFLRENPTPQPKGVSREECEQYYKEVIAHLHKLKMHSALENKAQRIAEFCHSSASGIFDLPYPPSQELALEIAHNIIDSYRDDENLINDSFLKLENNERAQILSALIKLSLSQIEVSESQKTPVNSKFYSTIKQWERLLIPVDEAISRKISMLAPGGTEPTNMDLLREVDVALHQSPVSLEGLYEGQKGLQAAITTYGMEKIVEGADANLRKLADRLGMRNGEALLASQFINYYSNTKLLLSSDGINSTQGRELFSRALLDAFQNATPSEKQQLLAFIQKLEFNDEVEPCTLKTSHQAFIDEALLRCSNLDPEAFREYSVAKVEEHSPETLLSFIDTLTKESNEDGTDKLFGFAKEINILSLQIEHALNSKPVDASRLDVLYSKVICSNLAYQLLLDQVTEETAANLGENFEYTREMALAQANINKLQDNLINFAGNLDRESQFFSVFSKYVNEKKFDGPPILAQSASRSDIPGFISLGGNRSLDVLHGAVYVGNNRLGMMPAHLQSHIAVNELGLNQLPFRPLGGGYAYSEGKEIKAFIMPSEDGTVTIQRELMTFDGTSEMLQYISPEKMDSVPMALKRRLNAEHFFIDSKGTIHAYTSNFKPILKLAKHEELWTGELLDHNGNKTTISLDSEGNTPIIQNLSRVFPQGEMISVDSNTVYIPSISKYVISDKSGSNYFISDNLIDSTSRKHLTIMDQGSAHTERVLTESESQEVLSLQKQIDKLKEEHALITKSDLVSKQNKSKLEKKIKECESRIRDITTPENFVFVSDSKQIQSLEQEHLRLRKEMQQAYTDFREGGKKDKEKLSTYYEKAKEDYLQNKKALQKADSQANYLRVFDVKEGTLHAKDFASILYVGLIPGKTDVLTQSLASSVPKFPLKLNELEDLRNLKVQFKDKSPISKEEQLALIMLIGTELQHHILERSAAATGKLRDWDRATYNKLLTEFTEEVKRANELHGKPPLSQFGELWRAIQSEFSSDKELQEIFTKSVQLVDTGEKKPININTKTTNMPIETMGARTLVEFKLHDNPQSLIDPEQVELERSLQGITGFESSVQAQEDGYYYENYGLFNTNTFEKLFSVTYQHAGIGGLTKEQVTDLFKLMEKEGWIRKVPGMEDKNKYQITRHPSEFYSSAKIAGYLNELGFERNQSNAISERLEIFLYQTAVNGGSYKVNEKNREELIQKVTEAQDKCNLEYLEALDKIESTLAKASSKITFADLNAAYLLNDYSSILADFPEKDRAQVEIVLNNGMTRLLYYKTELDHLNDVQFKFKIGQDSTAVAMLHTRRNYQLDKLLDSETTLDDKSTKEEIQKVSEERKMQRAFLLFESEFGHRCNARQVNIFRGLLLDDATDPDKIDSAQARMGFGKTSLLPLVALYKTGDKLVRFIVPKSALETNTADMSTTLTNILGRRAVKDDFQRYRIATDPETGMGENSPCLKSLQDAKADLQKRLALYHRVRDNKEVLVQAPSVRNSMECQAKIFLDMLMKVTDEPLQKKELMACISLLNEIRSLTTVSVFDELDATQDPATTEVNYTAGEKISLDTAEIYPLEVITQTIGATEDKSIENLAKVLLNKFGIEDVDESIFKYITSLKEKQPPSVTPSNSTEIYLIRAILSDPVMLSIFTEKEPGTDFGVWFENAKDGSKLYDYEALKTGRDDSRTPLLIAIPYSAANTPKPQGSRFDNPEVTAITTMLYYLDPRTEINELPHLEFLIDSMRKGIGEAPFLDSSGEHLEPEFKKLFNEISALAEIEDPLIRNEERKKYFAGLEERIKEGEIAPTALRKMLARTIIQEQVKFDAGKANSNRYEQGTTDDVVIGFSGTAGDTSSHFKENMLDPAADGNMTLGIMGRKNCQATTALDTTSFAEKGEDYNTVLVKQLAASFTSNTRTLIDVGGLCKASNRAVAKEIALQLKESSDSTLKNLKGVIFYDDVTNMKKLLVLEESGREKIVDLTSDMVAESDQKGSYFTYYDQSHSRGADIKQMDKAHAVLTMNFNVTNNDYKQAIMRMRKIVDKSLGQSFSTAVPDNVREKIIDELNLGKEHTLTGNDIAVWLRQKELKNNLNNISVFTMELDSIIKNAILQQQGKITQLMSQSPMTEEQLEAFRECIRELNNISPFISGGSTDLIEKYGKVYGTVKKEDFVKDLHESFGKRLNHVFDIVNRARENIKLPLTTESDRAPYVEMEKRIVQKREAQLSPEFVIPSSSSALAEAQSETENQSESQSQSQSQSQTQTHSFSEVANEEVVVEAKLRKHEVLDEPASIAYLSESEKIDKLVLASQTPHMQHLFKDEDPIRCSPAYSVSGEKDHILPPVRYFIAREEGNPKIILINQDEANLFKSSPVDPWSLYDVRLKKGESLEPMVGSSIASLNESILKKVSLASFRYELKGQDIESLAQSLEGICTPNQLHPSLSMKYETSKNIAKDGGVFSLPKWGFYGEKQQDIQFAIEQTQVKFKEGKYEKRGVTVSFGKGDERAEVFISSKLNKRILDEVGKQERAEVPVGHPKLKAVIEQVKKEHDSAMKERSELRSDLKDLKSRKNKVIQDADQKISELEEKKRKAIEQARVDISKGFEDGMKNQINRRKYFQSYFAKNIGAMCRLRVGDNKDFGVQVFGKTFPNLEKAIAHAVTQLYAEHKKKAMTSEELNSRVDFYIEEIVKAAEERFHSVGRYRDKTTTALETLHAASKEATPMSKEKIELLLKGELQDLKQAWMKGDKWDKLVAALEEVTNITGKNLSIDEFHQKTLEALQKFASENGEDLDKTGIVPRLFSSLTLGEKPRNKDGFMAGFLNEDPNKVRNHAAIRSDIANFIKRGFAGNTNTPSEEQREFFTAVNSLVNSKINRHNYDVPATLLDFESPISLERMNEGIKQTLTTQNVRTVKKDTDSMARECSAYLVGRKALENILDHYKPLENRSSQIDPVEGQEAKFFSANFERLTKLDTEVLDIQRQIDEVKSQKKAHLGQLEEEHVVLRDKLQKNGEKVSELKGEISALNKLISGIKKVLSVFTNHQVKIEQDDPIDFLDTHLDLGAIIQSEVSATATLTFTPPEFYDLEKDMQAQFLNMHGLEETTERRSEKSFDEAATLVRETAGKFQERESLTVGLKLASSKETELVDKVQLEQEAPKVERASSFKQQLSQIRKDQVEALITPIVEQNPTQAFKNKLKHEMNKDEEVVMTVPVHETTNSFKDKIKKIRDNETTAPDIALTGLTPNPKD